MMFLIPVLLVTGSSVPSLLCREGVVEISSVECFLDLANVLCTDPVNPSRSDERSTTRVPSNCSSKTPHDSRTDSRKSPVFLSLSHKSQGQ